MRLKDVFLMVDADADRPEAFPRATIPLDALSGGDCAITAQTVSLLAALGFKVRITQCSTTDPFKFYATQLVAIGTLACAASLLVKVLTERRRQRLK